MVDRRRQIAKGARHLDGKQAKIRQMVGGEKAFDELIAMAEQIKQSPFPQNTLITHLPKSAKPTTKTLKNSAVGPKKPN